MRRALRSPFANRSWSALSILLLTLIVALSIFTTTTRTAHAQGERRYGEIDVGVYPHIIPRYLDATPAGGTSTLPCLSGANGFRCYSPQQIRRAYKLDSLIDAGFTGKGTTIAIINFFQNPTVREDLARFNAIFGLPEARLNIIAPYGLVPYDKSSSIQVSSALEIDLDVQWAHAIAPDATINLVLARTNSFEDISKVTKYVVDHNLGDIISQSFGGSETCVKSEILKIENAVFAEARRQGITVLASSGDTGALIPVCDKQHMLVSLGPGVSYPASDPLVTGVGGTTLQAGSDGSYIGEEAWNNTGDPIAGGSTGGGFSRIFARPDYQQGIAAITSMRGVPDIAYNADTLTGFPIVTGAINPDQEPLVVPVGGTSAGVPQLAAFTALLQQQLGRRVGFLNDVIYNVARSSNYEHLFRDIKTGNNTFNLQGKGGSTFVQGYEAGIGWDPTTGVGSPRADAIAQFLQARQRQDGAQPYTRATGSIHANLCHNPFFINISWRATQTLTPIKCW